MEKQAVVQTPCGWAGTGYLFLMKFEDFVKSREILLTWCEGDKGA
jgi:hypothetical protein